MKKFFSLVLALVMALSLTTVAWGAPVTTATGLKAALEGSGEVVLANNVTLNGEVSVINVTGDVTLTATSPVTIDASGIEEPFKVNGGKLTLGANVTIKSNDAIIGVYSGGELVVNGATIYHAGGNTNAAIDVSNGTMTVNENSTIYKVNGTAIVVKGTLNIFGGTIYSDGGDNVAVSAKNSGVVNMTDGYVYSTESSAMNIQASGGTLNIDGGMIDCGNGFVAVHADSGTINVTDGTINGIVDSTGGAVVVSGGYVESVEKSLPNTGSVSVTGGTFGDDSAAAFVPAGTSVVPDAYGNYVLADTADVPTGSSSKPYFTTDFVNFKVAVGCDLANYKYELRHYYNGADAAKMFDKKVIVEIDEFGGLTYLYEVVVAASKDSATLAFVNGTQITYLNTVQTNWVGKANLVKTVDFDDAAKCGDVFTKNDVAVYEDANGVLYVENKNGAPYNVGGKLVLLIPAADVVIPVDLFLPNIVLEDNVVYTIGHDYDYNLKSVNGKQSVTSVFCKDKDCGKTFKFLAGTEAEAIAKFKAGNYVDTGLTINNGTVVWVAKDGVSANLPVTLPSAGTATDKVTSAETFDAGIAMYVGMSVLAATGSAVVLGKKKD